MQRRSFAEGKLYMDRCSRKVLGTLEQGERVRVGRPVTLQIQGKEERLHLK
jgi:hypothetical protein